MSDFLPAVSHNARAAAELYGMIITQLILLLMFTWGMVWYFKAPLVPGFVSVIVTIAWYLGLAGTLLLPADIADVQVNGISSSWLKWAWYTVYWSTFVLAWLVMPILNSAWHAGELTWRKRIKSAIRANVVTYILMAVGGFLAMVFLLVKGIATKDTLSGFLMAWGNTYGLMLIVLLMGHGLVEVPRQLWIVSFPNRELQLLYFRATQIDTQLYDAIYDLEDAEKEFDRLQRAAASTSNDVSSDQAKIEMHLAAIQKTREAFDLANAAGNDSHSTTRSSTNRQNGSVSPFGKKSLKKGTLGELITLHSRLRMGQERVISGKQQWDGLMKKVLLVELIISKQLPRPQSMTAGRGSNPIKRFITFLGLKGARMVWIWRLYIEHIAMRCFAVLCYILSALVIWSEVSLGIPTNLSPFGRITQAMEGHDPLLIQLAALIPFLYMSVCCYRSLFKLKLFGSMSLNGPHQSLPGQLMFNAQYLVRLQFPLGYNFLTLLRFNRAEAKQVAFNNLMSNMAVVPLLGTDFNIYAPLIMVVLCIFTVCHGYARLLRFVGIEHEDLTSTSNAEGQERLEEGKNLIERGKRQLALREQRRLANGAGGTLGFISVSSVSPTSTANTSSIQLGSFSPPATPVHQSSYKSYGRVNDV